MPQHPAQPLHQMNPTGRFSDRAEDYVRHRPTYPAAAIDAVLAGLRATDSRATDFGFAKSVPEQTIRAADVGAGTGISARLLADRGIHVTAVEPNAAMRAAAEAHPLVSWHAGTAEATGLPSNSVDLVLCAQAFHWFKADEALAEFRRILVPRGRLALMWNIGDTADAPTAAYYALVREASRGETTAMDKVGSKAPSLPGFGPVTTARCRNEQSLTADGLIGRAMSASYVPREGQVAERLIAGLRALHASHAGPEGTVRLVYTTYVYTASA